MQWIEIQEKRTFQTYKARVRAANRLRARGVAWTTALISASTASSIASIAGIVETDLYGKYGSVIAAIVSVLTLVASLVVTGVNYEARHRKMFDNYRKIQRLSTELEYLKVNGIESSAEEVQVLLNRYQDLLDESENHSELDNIAVRTRMPDGLTDSEGRRWQRGNLFYLLLVRESVLTFLPYAALGISAVILFPVFKLLF